jgi:hypothetical protein
VIKLLKVIGLAFVFIGLVLAMVGLIVVGNYLPRQKVYDCSLAEFHPDYPIQVKEECRRMKLTKIV